MTNLVFIFADQMRAHSQGYFGRLGERADPVHTPRLDGLAAQGLVLRQAVSTFPVCSPYRAMLMSGRYPHESGVMGNIRSALPWELRDEEYCLTDALAEIGYDVGYIGKWHLTRPHEPYLPREVNAYSPQYQSHWNEFVPRHRRHGITFWHGYNTFDRHLDPMYWPNDAGRDEWIRPQQWGPEHEADRAIEFIQGRSTPARNPSRPLALFVSMNPPHPDYEQVPDQYREAYRGRSPAQLLVRDNVPRTADGQLTHERACRHVEGHFAMTTGVDEQVGRIIDALDAAGLGDDTLVVFTSDHGEMMGSHGLMDKNNWYEEAMRVPMILRLPRMFRGGSVDDLMLEPVDLPPTLLGLMGYGDSIPQRWSGADRSAVLRGEPGPRPTGQPYFHPQLGLAGLRTMRYTLVKNPDGGQGGDRPFLLFDREVDPFQCDDVSERDPSVTPRLIGEFRAMAQRIGGEADAGQWISRPSSVETANAQT